MARVRGTTICALASPPGGGRRAVLRLSGPEGADLVRATCRTSAGQPVDLTRRGHQGARFDDGRGEQPARVLWMPAPRSYTGEDVAELHLVAAPPLVAAALRRLVELGAEPAGPGEFTRRAFLNGRMDLTRAEGVLALVEARTAEERRAASALLCGGLDERLGSLRGRLDDLRALAEASLDFDESDTGHVPREELEERRAAALEALGEVRGWEERRAPGGGEPRVVLLGRPNAGKSSLFNRLVEGGPERRSLVADVAGTTRDARHGSWSVAGVGCRLIDTAGSNAGALGVEARAQASTAREREAGDLVVHVVDATVPVDPGGGRGQVVAWNKIDAPTAVPAPAHAVPVSALEGTGLERLEAAVARGLGLVRVEGEAGPAPGAGIVRELDARHGAALARAREELLAAGRVLVEGGPLDLFAEHLRDATAALDRVSGRTTPEDVLDRIFARFCVGK